ncbi:MAG: DUF1802 family protein [Nostoc sp. NMS1]|uniref:DUF1802 family protein n=1 Tax=unclassified Nostoc TaxID=2593658 RepID=UPI0025D286C6|nr:MULTISPECIES: DUF1802 family protein [unclassified Nostoc]MBN3908670.1 DUF1802 family protein [Nostoc sp. NMS1]MBN3993167.1 DUF1802 family protein [Nostoc sp. NMS2]
MNQQFSIPTALCLPVPDIEALIQGRTIAALPRMFIRPGQRFALYPADSSVSIKAWAKCELCQILDETKPLDILSKLTIWTPKVLKEILQKQQYLFLAYLRVYQLPLLQEISVNPNIHEKLGKFVSLPNSLTVSEEKPVLTDRTFAQRKRQLEKLEPPLHPELEELQSAIASLTISQPAAKQLDHDIQVFFGWSSNHSNQRFDSDLIWIKKIADVGNSSDGNEFERLVRRSLIKLGFSCSNTNPKANLDPEKLGGAGGVDFYCEYPYPVVGECKATKSENVPSKTPGQLIQLGKNHLQEKYDSCLKIIVAAGELTPDALLTTINNQMNVIRPETLQKLVELQAHYKNSINLLELKEYLQQAPFGLAEDKINTYIDKVEQSIRLRSQVLTAVKELSEQDNETSKMTHQSVTVTEIRVHYNATHNPKLNPMLNDEVVHDLLIELSSPLTGYLGRIKSSDWKSDRFYFLRDLPIN